jgi:rubrerythrin
VASERIRTEEPVKNTIHNLVQTLSVKLDSASRYGLYQDDATKDGFEDCAELFAKMAETEQRDIEGLVRCLQRHIGESGAGE